MCTAAPLQALEVYRLPEQMLGKVQEQYERDVARVHGGAVASSEAEYKSFLAELGGGPPPELMGLDPATGGLVKRALGSWKDDSQSVDAAN